MNTITERQTRKLHALRRDLGLDEAAYRDLLSHYAGRSPVSATSSSDLSVGQASGLIAMLDRTVDATPGLREEVYASEGQVNLIAALWRRVSRATDDEGRRRTLDAFLSRRFRVRWSNHLPRRTAPGIIKALRLMNARASAPGRSTYGHG